MKADTQNHVQSPDGSSDGHCQETGLSGQLPSDINILSLENGGAGGYTEKNIFSTKGSAP